MERLAIGPSAGVQSDGLTVAPLPCVGDEVVDRLLVRLSTFKGWTVICWVYPLICLSESQHKHRIRKTIIGRLSTDR